MTSTKTQQPAPADTTKPAKAARKSPKADKAAKPAKAAKRVEVAKAAKTPKVRRTPAMKAAARMRRWARWAIVANIVFTVAWLLAATWQGPNYNSIAHTISDMYADGAPGAWVLIVLFTLAGAAVMMFALRSLWPALREAGRPARIGSILLALSIFGLGDLLSLFEREGCRLADAGCTAASQTGTFGGATDATLSTIGVAALAVGGFFLAAAMKKLPAWTAWARPTRNATIAFIVIFVLDGVLGGAGLSGLCERGIALAGAAGITALAIGILRRTPKPTALPTTALSTAALPTAALPTAE